MILHQLPMRQTSRFFDSSQDFIGQNFTSRQEGEHGFPELREFRGPPVWLIGEETPRRVGSRRAIWIWLRGESKRLLEITRFSGMERLRPNAVIASVGPM